MRVRGARAPVLSKNQRGTAGIPVPEMSPGPSTTPGMQPNPPPGSPPDSHEEPSTPVAVPTATARLPGMQTASPDPGALRRVPVPDCAPPYDGGEAGSPVRTGGQPRARPADSQGQPPGEPEAPVRSGRTTPGAQGAWPRQFAQALAEALAGSRPAQQLTPWTTEQTRQRIRQLGPVLATGQRPRLRRLMTSVPASDVLELTAVVGFGPRVRVLALRLERVEEPGEHWRCTEIESA